MEPTNVIVGLIIASGIFMVVLLVCREITCWYFKLSDLSTKMDAVNKNLAAIREALDALR